MKFPFKRGRGPGVLAKLKGVDFTALETHLISIPEESDMELIIRKKIRWDVEKMKRYFEGPVVTNIKNQYAGKGYAYPRLVVRGLLKDLHLRKDKNGVPVSTSSLDFEHFKEFLADIEHWSIELFGCGLPEVDDGDIDD